MKKFKINSPYIWAFTTYFTEGFPYTIIRQISSFFFRDMGVKLESIGLLSLLGIPWMAKFLWGPLVDKYSTKRSWLLTTQLLLSITMLLISLFSSFEWGIFAVATLFFVGAIFSATHDIAIDGFYMDALDKDGQSKFVGYRVMAYRIAMLVGTGVISTIGARISWPLAFATASIIFTLFYIYHLFFLPKFEKVDHTFKSMMKFIGNLKFIFGAFVISGTLISFRYFFLSDTYKNFKDHYPILKKIYFSHWITISLFLALLMVFFFRRKLKNLVIKNPESYYSKAFLTFIDRKHIKIIFGAIIFLRAGEYMLSTMIDPFFVDLGIKEHYGWIKSLSGVLFSILGGWLGGKWICDWGLKKVLWPFLFLQNFTNVIYMILAFYLNEFVLKNTGNNNPEFIGIINLSLVAITQAFDQFAGGLGTAVLMTFLMRICLKEYKAAHYAIGTGFMNINNVFTGVSSGYLCAWFGYGWFFGISFLISIPGMIFAGLIPEEIIEKK